MEVFSLKFVLVGDCHVGKSQLSRTFGKKQFNNDSQTTVGMEFSTKTIEFERCVIKAQIWDTAGQDRFEGMTRVYFRDALGAALVYDICCRESFDNLKTRWKNQIKEFGKEDFRLILVGNKVDLVNGNPSARQVSIEEAIQFAEEEGMDFVETSALTGQNVELMFRRLILSTAKLLPSIKTNLELAALPDGWMIFAPMEESLPSPPAANRRLSVRKVDISIACSEPGACNDPFAMEIEHSSSGRRRNSHRVASSLPVGGFVTMNNLHSHQHTCSTADSDGATTLETSSYDQSSMSSHPHAPPSSLYTRPRLMYMNYWTGDLTEECPEKPADPGLTYIAGTIRKTTTPAEVTKSLDECGNKNTTSDDRAMTERSSSARTFKTNEDSKDKTDSRCRRCFCNIL